MSGVPPEVVELVRTGRRFCLLAHLYPDGDVLGSQLGLGLALREDGRSVAFACRHAVPEPFHFLPGAGDVQQWKEGRGEYDVVVTLDCPDPGRVGGLLDGLRLTPAVAVNLYTAIVTDTGSFRYSNTTPETFRIAARLVEAGADPADVGIKLYETRHLAGLHLLGRILQQVETNPEGTIAWVVIDKSQTESPDLLEAEDFITYPRSLRTAQVAVLFRELAGEVKVSLRAKGEVNVARIAARFGGGGHPNAAGVVLPGDVEHAKAAVLGAVREALAEPR